MSMAQEDNAQVKLNHEIHQSVYQLHELTKEEWIF